MYGVSLTTKVADKFEPIAIKIEREDDDWLVDEPRTSHYVESKIETEKSGEEKKFKCNLPNCKYSTNVFHHFKNHEATHSDERPHKCDKCVRSFKVKRYLRNHREKVHFKELGVERKKHKGEIFTCKELDCKFSTHYKGSLKTHKVIHSKKRPYKCDKCERAFKRRGEFKNHLQSHSEESPYQCDKCEKAFKTKQGLTSHKFTHISEKELEKLKCDKCNKSFKQRIYLKNHMRLHCTEAPFQCDKCDRAFKVKGYLALHKLIHGPKDDWYKCEECEYATTQRCNLRNHQFKHTDAKGLGSHKKNVHSDGEKTFKCDKCDYR